MERGTEVTLVSNTGATAFGSNFNMGRNTRDQYRFEFTTGPNETGYTLGRFGIFIDTEEFGFGENCDARIYEATSHFSRGPEIVDLRSPHRTAYTNNSVNYFTAKAHHLLEPGTTYQLTALCNGNDFDNEFLIKTTTSHDETGETGWSIADGYRHSGNVLHSGRVMMGEVLGYVNPPDPGINLSKTATTILEGNTDTYEVSLKTPPTDTVTVDLSVPVGSDASISPTSLTFVTDEWDDPQTVTITTSQDSDDQNDSVRITHEASGGNYEDVDDAYLDLTITDDDTPNFDISETLIELEEEATSDTDFTVELTTLPTADVTVTVTSEDTAVMTVTQGSSLTFTDETWDEPQTVKIRAVQDEDAVNEGSDINLVGSGGGYDGVTGSVTVTVEDDETAGFAINPPVAHGGRSGHRRLHRGARVKAFD